MNSNQILELDKITTPHYILDVADWGQVQSTHHSFKYVNQIGVTVTSTSLETRNIEITGWIIAETEEEMSSRKAMLNAFVNPQEMLRMEYKDYALEFLPTTSIQYTVTVVDNNEVVCKFKIAGLAPDPLFHTKEENGIQAGSMIPMFHFPLMIGGEENGYPTVMFGRARESLILNITNSGSVSTGMVIKFIARSQVVNPSIINIYTREYFKINKTLTAGETVTIDTNIGSKKVVGGSIYNFNEYNYYKYKDLGSSWIQLQPGRNLLRYNAEESTVESLECYIYFYDKFLEVQECN
jgi:hypothetical protein